MCVCVFVCVCKYVCVFVHECVCVCACDVHACWRACVCIYHYMSEHVYMNEFSASMHLQSCGPPPPFYQCAYVHMHFSLIIPNLFDALLACDLVDPNKRGEMHQQRQLNRKLLQSQHFKIC